LFTLAGRAEGKSPPNDGVTFEERQNRFRKRTLFGAAHVGESRHRE
jgi:hypothetical protein